MILVGNQRGGAKNLADHLLKEENDHVTVHEVRGFATTDLTKALQESYAVSRGTKCKQHLFSLSLNPPPDEKVKTEHFEKAISQVEERLNLSGQPRAIVFHEKEGRRHAHAVWSRIDTEEMKAVHLPHTKRKLQDVSRDLYLEHGWKMPRGLMKSEERDVRNFTLAQWQQAKRTGKDPRAIKQAFADCWAVSDSPAAFANAMRERGYTLAKGDRRGHVALDMDGEVYAVAKWASIKTKDVRQKLGDEKELPSVAEAKARMARQVSERLHELRLEQKAQQKERAARMETARQALIQKQRQDRASLTRIHALRQKQETQARQARISAGLRGLFERLSGQRRRMKEQNEREAYQAFLRDRAEKDQLIFKQLEQRQRLQTKVQARRERNQAQTHKIKRDITRYETMAREKPKSTPPPKPEPPKETRRTEFKERRRRQSSANRTRSQPRGPELDS